jgi:hypothetical protein
MTIALQGSSDANATSVAITTHAINDTILFLVYRDNSTASPTIPSDCVVLHQQAMGAAGYLISAFKVAKTTSETSGTWTNASHIIAMVFRPDANSLAFPEYLSTQSATSATVTFAAQSTGILRSNAEDLAVVGLVAQRNSANNLAQAPGTMTNIRSGGNGSTYQVAANWEASRTTAWAAANITVATSALYRTAVIGMSQVSFTSASGGAMFFRPGINGGID